MLWKALSLSQHSSLRNNPLIQAIEFIFWFCLLLPIFYSMHYSFVWVSGKSYTAASYLPTQAAQPSFEAFVYDVCVQETYFYACVGYYCCTLNIITRVCMWTVDLCGSIAQCWVHLEHLGPLLPVGNWTQISETMSWVRASHGCLHEVRHDH